MLSNVKVGAATPLITLAQVAPFQRYLQCPVPILSGGRLKNLAISARDNRNRSWILFVDISASKPKIVHTISPLSFGESCLGVMLSDARRSPEGNFTEFLGLAFTRLSHSFHSQLFSARSRWPEENIIRLENIEWLGPKNSKDRFRTTPKFVRREAFTSEITYSATETYNRQCESQRGFPTAYGLYKSELSNKGFADELVYWPEKLTTAVASGTMVIEGESTSLLFSKRDSSNKSTGYRTFLSPLSRLPLTDKSSDEERRIADLAAYPAYYEDEGGKHILVSRGRYGEQGIWSLALSSN